MPSLLDEPAPELPGGRRLAGSLEPEQQDDARVRLRRRQPAGRIAEQREHLVANDPDDLLRGRQAFQHFRIDGAIAHPIDERLDDLEIDVRLEQRHADLAQRRFDGRFRQPEFTPE